jgi:AcrR family transcriptional regulator
MPQQLVDLLWRRHPDALGGGARGPRAKHSISEVVEQAVALADRSGLDSVTIRALADSLSISTMSVYTHVNSRDDLLVLMVDTVYGAMALPYFGRAGWRTRLRRTAETNLALLTAHPWLLQVKDPRTALGPGTIAKYDHELHIFDGTSLEDLHRDAALSFLLDFVGSNANWQLTAAEDFGGVWAETADRLGRYIGDGYPLAQRIGQAAGQSMGAPYSAAQAWKFGLDRVIAGLADIID